MKVAFYIRVNGALYTSDNQPNGAIFTDYKNQENICLEYSGANNYEVAKIYRDLYKGSGMERPALRRMYRDANKFNKIIISDPSRLSRDIVEYTNIINNFEDLGVKVEFANDKNTIQTKLLYNIVNMISEDYNLIKKG